jgi:DNA-binding GntR family transcriptional regulator
VWARITAAQIFPGGLPALARPLQHTKTHLFPNTVSPARSNSRALPHVVEQPATPTHVADEHKAIFEAALARDAELAVDLMTNTSDHGASPRDSRPSAARRPTRGLADVAMSGNGHLR